MAEPIHVQEVGSGTPLLLVHGDFNNGPGAWSRQMQSLAAHHRMLVVDRRGHGESPREPRPYTIANDAKDILEAADLAGAETFHLAGHSYGGLVAIEIARREPHRIRSLHLAEPPYLALLPDHPEVAPLIERGLEIQRNACSWGPERTAEAFFMMLAGEAALARLTTSAGWPSVVREAGRLADGEYPSKYPAASLDDLQLDAPIKIYAGGRSNPGLRAVAARLADLIPSAELVVIPNATHAVPLAGEPFDQELLAITTGR